MSTFPRIVMLCLLVGGPAAAGDAAVPDGSWRAWGGPRADFLTPDADLADSWPEKGPRRLWSRPLGEGYSGVLFDEGVLFTMFRDGEAEVVAALGAARGETIWEHRYRSEPREGHVHRFGDGPRATPLLTGDRIYTIGVASRMHCLDKATGAVLWTHDLWTELGGNVLNHGYSSSPVEYEDTVIVLVGGKGASVVALDKKTGAVRWKGLDFENSYSTPRIVEIEGVPQIVAFMATHIIGVDPSNGRLLWSWPHENQFRQNVAMPVLTAGNRLFLSSPEAGSRTLELAREADGFRVEEVWSSKKLQFYHGTCVGRDGWLYGSTGMMSPAYLTAVNLSTGEVGWRARGFAKANVIGAGDYLLILDEDGKLALAKATPEGLSVLSRFELFSSTSWTAPTLVGRTLYARDNSRIVALGLP